MNITYRVDACRAVNGWVLKVYVVDQSAPLNEINRIELDPWIVDNDEKLTETISAALVSAKLKESDHAKLLMNKSSFFDSAQIAKQYFDYQKMVELQNQYTGTAPRTTSMGTGQQLTNRSLWTTITDKVLGT